VRRTKEEKITQAWKGEVGKVDDTLDGQALVMGQQVAVMLQQRDTHWLLLRSNHRTFWEGCLCFDQLHVIAGLRKSQREQQNREIFITSAAETHVLLGL
jgi:hypothetical protein